MANPLAGLTPAELAQTPALMPPAGVVPNFINPPGTLEAVTNATMAICFTFTTIFVLVRLLTKYCVDRAFLWEDCQYYTNHPKLRPGRNLTRSQGVAWWLG